MFFNYFLNFNKKVVDFNAPLGYNTPSFNTGSVLGSKQLHHFDKPNLEGIPMNSKNVMVALENPLLNSVDVNDENFFMYMVSTVDELDKDQLFEAVAKASVGIKTYELSLAVMLHRVFSEGWYKEEGHTNFESYIDSKFSMSPRQGRYMLSIVDEVNVKGLPWGTVAKFGWSKLKTLCKHKFLTKDNIDEWLKRSEQLSCSKLEEYCKDIAKKEINSDDSSDSSSTVDVIEHSTSTASSAVDSVLDDLDSNPVVESDAEIALGKDITNHETEKIIFSVSLYKDQNKTVREAIKEAASKLNTESPAHALEMICAEYLSGAHTTEVSGDVTLEDLVGNFDLEELLTAVEAKYPTYDITVAVPDDEA